MKHHPNYNPKNNLASMPQKYFGQFYNGGCPDPCDMLQGPCACGATHHQEEWPDNIQEEVFGYVSTKESGIKRKPRIDKMKVYLVEVAMGKHKKLEPIAIKTNFEIAYGLIRKDQVGIITELEVDKDYSDGIGVCEHWHFPDEPEEEQ